MDNISVDYIKSLNYTDFISFIKETNRCPGGKASIREIVKNSFLSSKSKILDVGSNTGFNSFELAHITDSKVYGIDVSESCVDVANSLLNSDSSDVKKRVKFNIGSAYDIPFKDNYFDLVMCGGATSFMDDKNKAVNEYFRVLKPWAFLATTQLFYHTKPPQRILEEVSKIIGAQIEYRNKNDWLEILNSNNKYELYYFKEYKFSHKTNTDVDEYISLFMEKPHIKNLAKEVKEEICSKWLNYISVFSENNDYLSYFIALFRKNILPEEKEFFVRQEK